MHVSRRRGNCIHTNEAIGRVARRITGITIHDCLSSIRIRAEEKANIIAAIEKKRGKRPNIIFVVKVMRKSSSE
ncbi:hypothetical protein D8674_041752 [Pyrus ussuriensis x Pyrus communis]|uniref:Uncharacterized protein n=1 Tax=Pyrus ussuriensis x Pyrus communis TaxID=2448454 RepID=A0A5N5GFQ5_9ROSA|nr:hypothetical protein D8674_041871 [Pyrus ussuriensis x Pyrus communis]KAB2614335.1 hypothetical protein D8674_041752 [Pyrus ussuriensis x Pyrus communis]